MRNHTLWLVPGLLLLAAGCGSHQVAPQVPPAQAAANGTQAQIDQVNKSNMPDAQKQKVIEQIKAANPGGAK